MLRLLAQREQGYDDIAALMGLSVGEVRAKVVGALAQLEAEGEPRPDVPPPFPVAGEEGAAPAKAPAAKPDEPAAEAKAQAPAGPSKPEPAAAPSAAPAEPSFEEKPPAKAEPTAPKAAPTPAASSGGGSSGGGRTVTIPSGRGLWPWIGGAVAIIAVVVIVILIAGGGGGNSSSTEAAATSPPTSEETGAEEAENGETSENASNPATSKEATFAALRPVGGGSASGKATFGRIKNKLALLVEAEGLETTGKGDAYTVWLAQSENKMLPLASSGVAAKSEGKIAAQFEVKTEILAYLANGTFDQIYVTHTQNAQLKASVEAAVKKGAAPAYTGETVLKGTVTGPIVGFALREEEAQEAKEKGE
jgi:hypothetical protein